VRHPTRWFWIITGLASGLVILLIVFAAAVPLSSDTMRHRIVASLSKRMNSDVELGDLHLRVFPRMQAEGADLVIRERGRTDVPPLISIKRFTVDADLIGLIRKRVARVELAGLDIEIPPDDDPDDDEDKAQPERANEPRTDLESIEDGVVIDTLVSKDAKLVIIPRKAHKKPKVWAIHSLTMHEVGATTPMPFEAQLTNAIPPGEIDTTGNFGPWSADDPGSTPLHGDFTFNNADLGVFDGIGGTLSAKGGFRGSLERIDVTGETDVPNFLVRVGGHPLPLRASYHSIVDGTNGDTRLELIDATFLQSHLIARGAVLDGPPGEHGRTVTLDVEMDRARIEDVMRMAVPAPTPPMKGALKLVTKFLLPPGKTDVVNKLRLDGHFSIAGAQFTNYDVQGKIDSLSHRGSGKDPEATKARVFSQFEGRFRLGNGALDLSPLTFGVPGAKVQLTGSYALKKETLDFGGTMTMDAKISQTQRGFKSLLLKAIDPIFRRSGGGSEIPFKIGGTRLDPKFGLDMRRVFRRGSKS
jgi:hypothetical protein